MLLLQSATEWLPNWQKNGWKTASKKPVKNRDLLEKLAECLNKVKVHWQHVPAHTGIHGNEMADKLANQGAAID